VVSQILRSRILHSIDAIETPTAKWIVPRSNAHNTRVPLTIIALPEVIAV
jgi:hypothetical protein